MGEFILGSRLSLLAALLLVTGVAGCASNGLVGRLSVAPSPYQRYSDSLRAANLHETALGRDWLLAGDTALVQALLVSTPFRETGYFPLDQPSAVAYRLELKRGRRLVVDAAFESTDAGRLFVDLFETSESGAPERVASLGEGSTLTFEVPRDGTYVLRVQPELLRSGRFTVLERTTASLPFPVSGLTARAVQSEFGAERDAGRRQHEGLDIFAARDTPVLAVTDGTAQSDTNGLGGNVVWLRDARHDRSFYYAHLERWAFDGTVAVRAGDVVGYIGNTGNARTTAPHLHFGIYQRGPIDPLPFLQADDAEPPASTGSLDRLGELVRVTPVRTPLRDGTGRSADTRRQLERNSIARVLGITASTLRVSLPDGTTGYIDNGGAIAARTAIRDQRLAAGSVLREGPLPGAPAIEVLAAETRASVLGRFNSFELVRLPSRAAAWVAIEPVAR